MKKFIIIYEGSLHINGGKYYEQVIEIYDIVEANNADEALENIELTHGYNYELCTDIYSIYCYELASNEVFCKGWFKIESEEWKWKQI